LHSQNPFQLLLLLRHLVCLLGAEASAASAAAAAAGDCWLVPGVGFLLFEEPLLHNTYGL